MSAKDVIRSNPASALVLLGFLAGCGGGGGGGGGTIAAAPFQYPSSLAAATSADTVQGVSGAYSRTSTAITTVPQGSNQGLVTLQVNTPATGTTRFTVSSIGTASSFSFDINITTPPGGFAQTSFDGASRPGSPAGTACTNCFRSGTIAVNSPQTGNVEFIYLDLAAAGLTYSTLGVWERPASGGGGSTDIGGAFAYGVLTRGADIPTTGTASYTGPFVGRYAGTPTGESTAAVYTVGAAASASVDFGTRTTGFSTTDSMRAPIGGGAAVADNGLNVSGVMRWQVGVNGMSSSITGGTPAASTSYSMSGEVAARFMGEPSGPSPFAPPELAGGLAIKNGDGSQSMVGSFALKKQ